MIFSLTFLFLELEWSWLNFVVTWLKIFEPNDSTKKLSQMVLSQVTGNPARYIRFLFVFKRPLFFLCDFFSNLFSSKPSQFLLKTFCEHKALLKVFGTMRLAGDLHQKNFWKTSEKIFSSIFCFFFKGLRLRKMSFLLFSVAEELFSRYMGISSGFFGAVKMMKF